MSMNHTAQCRKVYYQLAINYLLCAILFEPVKFNLQLFHSIKYCRSSNLTCLTIFRSSEVVDENRTPPTDDDVEKLEEFIPTRSYHLTCIRPCVWLIAADLDVCDVTAKKIVHGSKYKRVHAPLHLLICFFLLYLFT